MIDRELNFGRKILDRITGTPCTPTQDSVHVLDIGAGTGVDLMICEKNIKNGVFHALEANPSNIDRLRAMNFEVHSMNLERDFFPFENESIDLVIANQILEHCKEIFWIFHEATRVLRVGGRMYIGVPNLASFHSRVLLMLGRQPTCIRSGSAHVRGFTKRDLVRLLQDCFPQGFRLVSFHGSNFYPFPELIAQPLAKLLPNFAACIFLLIEKTRQYESEFLEFPNGFETNFWLGPDNDSSVGADIRNQS